VTLYATNLLTGGYTEFSAQGVHEEHLGRHDTPGLRLSAAVAASCSIPPTFRPYRLRLDPEGWQGECLPFFAHVRRAATPLSLCDGGNHDNLALKAVWDSYQTLLVSDGSSPMPPWRWISGNWLATTLRSNRILIDQIRSLKKRILIKINSAAATPALGILGIASSADSYADGRAGARHRDDRTRHDAHAARRHTATARAAGQLRHGGHCVAPAPARRRRPGQWPQLNGLTENEPDCLIT
jgi:predicted acylesterase/phospholipase RssA